MTKSAKKKKLWIPIAVAVLVIIIVVARLLVIRAGKKETPDTLWQVEKYFKVEFQTDTFLGKEYVTGISETDETELRIEAFNEYMEANPEIAKAVGTGDMPDSTMTFQYLQKNLLRVEDMLDSFEQIETNASSEFHDTLDQLEEEQTQ